MRAWSDLLEGVAAGSSERVHPSPEELERYERAPAELDPPRSDFIAAHLQSCPACAEELHVLRGFNPATLRAAAATTPAPSSRERLRALLFSPALGLVLVGLLLFPLLYRSMGPSLPGPAKNQEVADAKLAEADRELANAEVPLRDAAAPSAAREKLARAKPDAAPATTGATKRSAAKAADAPTPGPSRAPAVLPPEPAARFAERERAAPAPAVTVSPTDPAGSAGFAQRPSEQAALRAPAEPQTPVRSVSPAQGPPTALAETGAPAGPPRAATLDVDTLEGSAPAGEDAARALRKSEDPLAHHVWIPTMRLRPGQKSSGPSSELRNGFFLEVPLPREIPAGEARIVIQPDGPLPRTGGPLAPLAAEDRALEALAKGGDVERSEPEARGFEERRPVEAKQRGLLLQIPPGVLHTGIYRVDLEIHSEGEIRGRGRFRLELEPD